MSTRTKAFLEIYGIPFAVCLCFGLLALHAAPALAEGDLSDGITTATKDFQKMISVVFKVAGVVIVVGGLAIAAFKFTQRDQHALHYLVGTIAAGVLCAIITAML